MSSEISIIVIDSDVDSLNSTVIHLKTLDGSVLLAGTATSFELGFELIHRKRPMVVVLDVPAGGLDSALENIKTILGRFPQTSIFAACDDQSSDTILKVMRAGATEYLLKPVSEVDLAAALQKMGRLFTSTPSREAPIGKIYTVFSPKSGVGVTTLAVNLAVDLHAATQKPTVLLDLNLNTGDIATFLNLKPAYTMYDVIQNLTRLDRNFLEGVVTKHESGIHVLAEPQKLDPSFRVSGDDIRKVLNILQGMYANIVLDTEATFNVRTMAGFEMSETILMTLVLSLAGIRNVQKYLDYLEQSGFSKDKIKLIVNRYLPKGDVRTEDAEKILKHRVFMALPNDYVTAEASINKGVPLGAFAHKSPLNLAIKALANAVASGKAH